MRPKTKESVIVIVGTTATGKSALAVRTAKKFGGEVISADSRQIYKGLDIGTGKITRKEMQGIPHHLLDIANPKKKFTAAEYKKLAEEKIKEVLARGHVPIVCGGTGFYIDAVTKGIIFPEVPPDHRLRRRLSKKTAPELFKMLQKLDAYRAQNIDKNNKVRLIRAIEIATHLGAVPRPAAKKPPYRFITIGLRLPSDVLKIRIEKRVRGMFKNGLLKEIQKLKKQKVSGKRLREFGFEYDDPICERVVAGTMKYARRQETWWKRDKTIAWFDPRDEKKILGLLLKEMQGRGQ